MAPSCLLSEVKHAHEIHGYNTRGHDLLRLPLAKTAKYQRSFRIKGARAIIDILFVDITHTSSLV